MIVIQLIGRLGNCMFLFGLGLSLQKLYPKNEVLFYYSKSFPKDTKEVCEKYIEIFQKDYNFKFLDVVPSGIPSYVNVTQDNLNNLEEIPIQDDIFLCSFFQSKNFLIPKLCQERLKCPKSIEEEISRSYGDISQFTSIHVRRGDYVNNNFFPCMTKEWYLNCMSMSEHKEGYIITSDDLDWCKSNLVGDNIVYVDKQTNNSDLLDMYIHSFCKNNIISASTFSWWGSYLNPYKDKKVYAPANWYLNFARRCYTENMILVDY